MTEAEARAVAAIDRCMADLARVRAEIAGDGIDPVTAKLVELREVCVTSGILVIEGGVGERDAAALLRLAPQTLRNRRCAQEPPDWFHAPGRRVRYRLTDLAEYLAELTGNVPRVT